jgi:hypothetical protein
MAKKMRSFLSNIVESIHMTFNLVKERAIMTTYFRTKKEPHFYFAGMPAKEEPTEQASVFILRPVGESKPFAISPDDLNRDYEACGPYEAIGSMSKRN